jgi:hypothetical protein
VLQIKCEIMNFDKLKLNVLLMLCFVGKTSHTQLLLMQKLDFNLMCKNELNKSPHVNGSINEVCYTVLWAPKR